jgi:trk system potassium uptake protein TrkA
MTNQRIVVIGLGRLGSSLIEELWDTHVEIMVIDKNAAAIDAIKDKVGAAFVGDGSDPRVLDGIGASGADVAIVTYGEDFEASVLAVAALAQMKVRHILARGANERQAQVLRAVGATRVVLVENEMGRRLAPEVLSPSSSDFTEYASSFRVVAWAPTGAIVGKTLIELDLRRKHEINVLGYFREGFVPAGKRKPKLAVPTPDYRVQAGDTLLLIGLHDAVEKFLAAV